MISDEYGQQPFYFRGITLKAGRSYRFDFDTENWTWYNHDYFAILGKNDKILQKWQLNLKEYGPGECPECHGSGTITSEQRTIFGSFLTKTTCPYCHGSGTTYEKTCSECHGKGKVTNRKTITVKVPAGIDNGNRLRVAGKGGAGTNDVVRIHAQTSFSDRHPSNQVEGEGEK